MKKFDIEEQWCKFLEWTGLDIATMDIDRTVELKRTFIAGVSFLFEYLDTTVVEMDEPEQDFVIADLEEQLQLFWKAESKSVPQ